MVTRTATIEYAPKTFGNVAYDLDREQEYRVQDEKQKQREEEYVRVKSRARVKTKSKAAAKAQSTGISAFSVFGMLITGVLIASVLFAHVSLTAVYEETANLETQLAELNETEAQLIVAYQSTFNLSDIERYAVDELGMMKPADSQIRVIDTVRDDAAVVVDQNTEGTLGTVVNEAVKFVDYLMSYFG